MKNEIIENKIERLLNDKKSEKTYKVNSFLQILTEIIEQNANEFKETI